MIPRDGVGPRAQRAHVDEPSDACLLGRRDQVYGTRNVDIFESTLAKFSDNADQVDHGVHPVQGALERGGVQQVADVNLGPVARDGFLNALRFRVAHQQAKAAAFLVESSDDFAADETRASSDEDFHEITADH